MEPQVVFENEAFLVLDKPAGWIVNEANTTTNQPVIQKWLEDKFSYPIVGNREFRSGIVHRLDKETSGILLVAKTKEAFVDLQLQFKNRDVQKTYTALLHGRLKPKSGEIETTVGRLPWRRDRFGVLPGGRESLSKYKVESFFVKKGEKRNHLKDYSLVTFYPKTGRTHQIRIHAKYVGHPIVGDDFYAGRKTAREDRKWCPRIFLHAKEISFYYPAGKKLINFTSKLPTDLLEALKDLQEDKQT